MTIEPILVQTDLLCDDSSFDSSIDSDDEILSKSDMTNNKTYLVYNEYNEKQNEINDYNSHLFKNNDIWIAAKTIVSEHNIKKVFFWDYLDILFNNNNDDFNNINKVIYSINNIILEFDNTIAKFIVDNLKINSFKPVGYIFSNNDNNIWDFKIVVITSKNIYSANRYIDENTIGFY